MIIGSHSRVDDFSSSKSSNFQHNANAKRFVFKPLPDKNDAKQAHVSQPLFGELIEEEKHDSSDEEEAKYCKNGRGNNAKKNQSVA